MTTAEALRADAVRLRRMAHDLLTKADFFDTLATHVEEAQDTLDRLGRRDEGTEKLARADPDDFVSHGVVFPKGTQLRGVVRGEPYEARIVAGRVVCQDTTYESLSAVATTLVGRPTNGWDFWKVKRPGDTTWTRATILRREEGGGVLRRRRREDEDPTDHVVPEEGESP